MKIRRYENSPILIKRAIDNILIKRARLENGPRGLPSKSEMHGMSQSEARLLIEELLSFKGAKGADMEPCDDMQANTYTPDGEIGEKPENPRQKWSG
ncbi:unnamed protein product [Amoebophrya sp. A25]|nr:unnamed protein product [Amoebophrya sp. A25]|eukprot:GSA25T00028064001.1